jgi:hypothetical protein
LQHRVVELAAQAVPAGRVDQAALLVVAERRRRDARPLGDFSDVHLDLKSA